MDIPVEGYSRHTSWSLHLISTLLLKPFKCSSILGCYWYPWHHWHCIECWSR